MAPPPLHSYQRLAVEFLRAQPRAALLLDMGLGKTATTLSALTGDHLPALVVAPKRVAEIVWPEEAELWRPDLSVSLAAGGPKQRHSALRAGADLTVIGRDVLKDAIGLPWKTIVLDESSSYKSHRSQRTRAAYKLAQEAEHCWLLTGTPAPNGLMDLFAQIRILDGGERLGKTLTAYRNRYFYPAGRLPNGIVTDWQLHEGAEGAIHKKIEDICLSMRSIDHLDLPPVTVNPVKVELPKQIRATYRRLKEDLVVGLDGELDGLQFSAANAAVLSSRLQQVTAGFLYPDTDDPDGETAFLHHAKLDALEEIVEGTESPILVFYAFKAELELLQKRFPEARPIDSEAIRSWNRGEVPMLLAHPASAGHGLNLQKGGHVIAWMTQPWSMELWEQANGRLARQGQEHPVVIHVIQAIGTVDMAVDRALRRKLGVHEALLDHLRSPV